MKKLEKLGVMLLGIGVGMMFGMMFGRWLQQKVSEIRAVEAGHAEYYLDQDYHRQWRWLPVTKEE